MTRRTAYITGILLLAMLLCAFGPAAYADGCTCASAQDMDPQCTCGCSAASSAGREELFEKFMESLNAADAEHDRVRRAQLYDEAQQLWDAYLDAVYAELDEEPVYNPTQEALVEASVGSIHAAGAERSPKHAGTGSDRKAPEGSGHTFEKHEREPWQQDDAAPDPGTDEYLTTQTDNTAAPSMGVFGLPDPWKQTELLEEALEVSGVDFCPPADESMPQKMCLTWYRAVPGTLEADYTNGKEELMLRASVDDEGYALSGDYNTYSHAWTEQVDTVTVDCLGDGEYINVAMFKNGDTAYALTMACGREGAGLTSDELASLVRAMLPAPAEVDLYADPVDIYADPKPQYTVPSDEQAETGKNGETMLLFTDNVQCAMDAGFGYAGLKAVRDSLEAQGYTTILTDGGNAVQGEVIGTLSKGEAVIDLMNALAYDIAIPGGHEFDYGVDQFIKLAESADFPYISCNFTCEGETALAPCAIAEANGKKIAFVGVTVPAASEMPVQSGIINGDGEAIVGFMQDAGGEAVYDAVQRAIDSARGEGADLICVLGNTESDDDFACAEIIANTTGIDVFFDSAADEQRVLKDKMGDNVVCVPGGEKLSGVGYCRIDTYGGIAETGFWSWPNRSSAALLLGLENDVSEMVEAAKQKLDTELGAVVTNTDIALDSEEEERGSGETAIGDFCADALRLRSGADIGLIGAGYIHDGFKEGELTYGSILNIFPNGSTVRVIGLTGSQLLDALEWGCRMLPEASGSFPQVSGLRFEVYTDVDTPCIMDKYGDCLGIEGERRVRNVLVNGEPVEPEMIYTIACPDAMLLDYPSFAGAWVAEDWAEPDAQVLIDYIIDDLNGDIARADVFDGQTRILIVGSAQQAGAQTDIYLTEDDLALLNELFARYLAERPLY